jgi:hypothetical protein
MHKLICTTVAELIAATQNVEVNTSSETKTEIDDERWPKIIDTYKSSIKCARFSIDPHNGEWRSFPNK